MKHFASLLLAACATSVASHAQISLSGSSYSQNFNSLGSGLPAGWMVDTGATPTFLGNSFSFSSAPTRWNLTSAGFRNYASANGISASNLPDTTAQATRADRALGVRQTGGTPGFDSGAAFVMQIANTTGLTAFNMSFQLQSLDTSSPRTTTWRVDYATGANPTSFTSANATGTLTTGNRTFSSNTVNVNFGTALNNQVGPVWIRIATVTRSTGNGNRATTAIDDVNLTWTGTGTSVGEVAASKVSASILGRATAERIPVSFSAAKAEEYTLALYAINGREVTRQIVRANAGDNQVVLQPSGIAAGQYVLRVSSASGAGSVKVTVE